MEWFYARGDMQRGPVTEEELGDLVRDGIISAETRVWREGMSDWVPLSEVHKLAGRYLKKETSFKKESPVAGVENSLVAPTASSSMAAAASPTVNVPDLPQGVARRPGAEGDLKQPPTYLVQAVIGLVFSFFCCFVPGIPAIVAIVFATKVSGLHEAGDFDGALEASKKARLWCNITGAVFLVMIILSVIANALDVPTP
ncbi:MAG: GYF domain-containing protein [Verrucomicrobiota bacterium]